MISMDFLLAAYYSALVGMLVISSLFPALGRQLIPYGKSMKAQDQRKGLLQHIVLMRVPKSWFWHFYATGLLLFAFMMLRPLTWWDWIFAVHLLRRLIESRFLEKHSKDSQMLVGHYLLGMTFYIATTLAIHMHCDDQRMLFGIAFCMFFCMMVCQYECHSALARLRSCKNQDSAQYSLPREGWFATCTSPHYSFEIGIYAVLYLVSDMGMTMTCLLTWVILNLYLSAKESKEWYMQKYPADTIDGKFVRSRSLLIPRTIILGK